MKEKPDKTGCLITDRAREDPEGYGPRVAEACPGECNGCYANYGGLGS